MDNIKVRTFRVMSTTNGTQWWGVGLDFVDQETADEIRRMLQKARNEGKVVLNDYCKTRFAVKVEEDSVYVSSNEMRPEYQVKEKADG